MACHACSMTAHMYALWHVMLAAWLRICAYHTSADASALHLATSRMVDVDHIRRYIVEWMFCLYSSIPLVSCCVLIKLFIYQEIILSISNTTISSVRYAWWWDHKVALRTSFMILDCLHLIDCILTMWEANYRKSINQYSQKRQSLNTRFLFQSSGNLGYAMPSDTLFCKWMNRQQWFQVFVIKASQLSLICFAAPLPFLFIIIAP